MDVTAAMVCFFICNIVEKISGLCELFHSFCCA